MPEEEAKPTVATIATSGKMFAMLDAASAPCAEYVVPTMDAANAPARTSFFIMDLHFKYFDVISVENGPKRPRRPFTDNKMLPEIKTYENIFYWLT